MVTANHEDETQFLFGRFLAGSAQKYRICGSHRSLLAEGSRRTSPLSCTGQPHYSIPFSDDPMQVLLRVTGRIEQQFYFGAFTQ